MTYRYENFKKYLESSFNSNEIDLHSNHSISFILIYKYIKYLGIFWSFRILFS